MATISGTSGNDNLTGTANADTFLLADGGNDTASGLAGNDVFEMGSSFGAGDQLDGGDGSDTIMLDGRTAVTLGASTITSIENIVLDAGHSYSLTTNDANVAAGAGLTVDGSALLAGTKLVFNGTAETDGTLTLIGGAGDDSLKGGGANDVFDLSAGGEDVATAAARTVNTIDTATFIMGAALDPGDRLTGGAGFNGNDTVMLSGNYDVIFQNNTLKNISNIDLAPGFHYDLTFANGNVSPVNDLRIDGHLLGAGDTLTVHATRVHDAGLIVTGGAGDDVLVGSQTVDIFMIGGGGNDAAFGEGGNDAIYADGALSAGDRINGGDGGDTLFLRGDTDIVFGAKTLQNVELIQLQAFHNYHLVMNDGNVAAGATLALIGGGTGQTVYFDGSAETDGHFDLQGSNADDTLIGGQGSDTFDMNSFGNDTIWGEGGSDLFQYPNVSRSNADTCDIFKDFDANADHFALGTGIAGIDAPISSDQTSGNLGVDLQAAVGQALAAHHALLVTFTADDFAGHTFLVASTSSTAGFSATSTYVFDVTGMTGTLTTGDFI